MPGRLTRLTRRGEFLKVASRGRKAARPGLVTMHDLPLIHRYNPLEAKSLGPKKR